MGPSERQRAQDCGDLRECCGGTDVTSSADPILPGFFPRCSSLPYSVYQPSNSSPKTWAPQVVLPLEFSCPAWEQMVLSSSVEKKRDVGFLFFFF